MSTFLIEAAGAPLALFQATPEAGRRFWEFFTVNIRNPNTRRAYLKAVSISSRPGAPTAAWKTSPA